MYCRNCGSEISDDAKFCPNCGTKIIEDEITEPKKTITFKDGILALFNKIFVFEGRSSRSEFNYGFLFLMIISTILSMFTITPELTEKLMDVAMTNPEMIEGIITETFGSRDIFNLYNLYNISISLVLSIFLSAPAFRRLTDCGFNKKVATVLTIVFVVSQILCSSLLWCLLPENIYKIVGIFLEILSYANTIILLICMIKKSVD